MSDTFMLPPAPIAWGDELDAANIPFPFRRDPLGDQNGSPHTPIRHATSTIPHSSSRMHRADTPLYSSPLVRLRFGGEGGGRALHREGAFYECMFRSPVLSLIELLVT